MADVNRHHADFDKFVPSLSAHGRYEHPASTKGKIVFAQVIHNAGVGQISCRMLYGL